MACGPFRPEGRPGTVRRVTDPADPRPLRILVVDPDDRTRESLCGILGIGERCTVVGHAGDARQALSLVAKLAPDMVVIDAHIDDEAAARIFVAAVRAASPATRIVVMSRSEEADPMTRCAGVDAVIRKTFRPRELVDALLAAAEELPGRSEAPLLDSA
jgi:DNA-binding NarL/FixJ family response regulator